MERVCEWACERVSERVSERVLEGASARLSKPGVGRPGDIVLTVGGMGLREMKRAETERRLAAISYDLVRARGWVDVTVDDIVEVAHVSRRTFSNYYACKEEAVAAVILHLAADGLDTWRAAGSADLQDLEDPDNLVALVRDLVRHQAKAGVLTRMAEVSTLARAHNQLAPYVREAQWRLWLMAGERLPKSSLQSNPFRRAELDAILGAVFGVVSASLARSLPEGTAEAAYPEGVRELVEHVLDQLGEGLGAPRAIRAGGATAAAQP